MIFILEMRGPEGLTEKGPLRALKGIEN